MLTRLLQDCQCHLQLLPNGCPHFSCAELLPAHLDLDGLYQLQQTPHIDHCGGQQQFAQLSGAVPWRRVIQILVCNLWGQYKRDQVTLLRERCVQLQKENRQQQPQPEM